MKAIWNGHTVADSEQTVVVEGNHYFPRESVDTGCLTESDKTTWCPWKGTANYYSITAGGETNADAAWYYADPKPEAEHIRDRIAFWGGVQIVE